MISASAKIENDAFVNSFVQRLRHLVGREEGFVPLHEPSFTGDEWKLVRKCLDSGWVSSAGKFVDEFEAELATRCGAAHCVAVVNGTAALHTALIVAGVKPGDEVIVPALTFVATANAVTYAGAIPHFVDSETSTLGVDAAKLRQHLDLTADWSAGIAINRNTGRRIAAIVPMHTFGHPVEMGPLLELGRDLGVPVIEDAAEALGSSYNGRSCGTFGTMGIFSFNGNKIITTGAGGAIVTNDADLAKRARHLTTTAKIPHQWEFVHDEIGYNYRLPNLSAALGCAQLAQLDKLLAAKRKLAEHYIDGFSDFIGVKIFIEPRYAKSNYWLNSILLDDAHCHFRDHVLQASNAAGLMCRPIWRPMHQLPMYEEAPRANLPVAERIAARLINIPSSANLAQ